MSQYFLQVDVIGVHIQDIVHHQDFMDLQWLQGAKNNESPTLSDSDMRYGFHKHKDFRTMRMRCAFTPSVGSNLYITWKGHPSRLVTTGFAPTLSDSDMRYGFFVRNGSTWKDSTQAQHSDENEVCLYS